MICIGPICGGNLHKLAVPALGVFGVHDNIVNPNQSKLLAKCVPQAQVEMMEASRHFPMLDEPASLFNCKSSWLG